MRQKLMGDDDGECDEHGNDDDDNANDGDWPQTLMGV